MNDLLLALDLGSTGVRALVVRGDGEVVSRAARRLTTRLPAPGRVEQDPEEMWRLGLEVCREALAGAGGAPPAGIGVVTQRATVVAWDAADGRPLGPAICWQDRRTADRVAELVARGIPMTTLPSATKLAWWLEHDESVRAAAARGSLRFGTPDAWLTWRLSRGAVHVTEPGQASCTALYDLSAGDWSAGLLELFSLDRATLPVVVASAEVVAETAADVFGAPVPIAARAGDQQAACFAQGVLAAGDAKLTLGTSAMLDLHAGVRPPRPGAGVHPLALWRLGGADAFCLEGSVITAGAAVDWLVSIGLLPDAASLDRVAGSVDSAAGVVFVPALQGLGTPWLDTGVRGSFSGLGLDCGGAHLVRAVVEGVAHRCVDLCEALEIDERPLRVDGGLARSDVLVQALADLSGRACERAAETETTALGAALLAGLGVGRFADATACAGLAPATRRFEPAASAERRREERERFAAALRSMR